MLTIPWIRGPVGLDAATHVTRTSFKSVLVMVPTMTAGTRVLDLMSLLEGDHRIQVVFTVPHAGQTWHGVDDFVRRNGGVVLPWHQAIQHRWDLVLSASHRHIEQVHGKVLILPHGAGSLMSRRFSRKARKAMHETTGLDRELLTYRGRVIPSALCLTHDHEIGVLRRLCPEALSAAVVTGDICLDRIIASIPFRPQYRRALGLDEDDDLITVNSTWTPESTFGSRPELYLRLIDELGASRTRVAAILHPNIWAVHGPWQIHTWLAPAVRRGLILIPPEEGWRATLVASDQVIGDRGSTTIYAAAARVPVHLAAYPEHDTRAGSIGHCLASIAPHLDHELPLLPQLRDMPRPVPEFAGLVSSRIGQAAAIFRATMYRLLNLPEPSWPATSAAVPLPTRVPAHGSRP